MLGLPPRPVGVLLGLALVACLGPLGSVGVDILVTDPSDAGGVCPGASCTLTAAWDQLRLNDTIVLNVSASIAQRLYKVYSQEDSPDYDSTLTIRAARPGLSVTGTQPTSFLGLTLHKARVIPTLQGFTLAGFNINQERLVCVDQLHGCTAPATATGTAQALSSDPARPPAHPRPRRTTEGQRRLWESKGVVPDPDPSVLRLIDMEISNNHFSSGGNGGLVYVACARACSAIYSNVAFKGNTIVYVGNLYGILHSFDFYSNTHTTLYMSNVRAIGNNVTEPLVPVPKIDSLIYGWGDVYIQDLLANGNTMGQGLGVVSGGDIDYKPGNVFIRSSSFAANNVFPSTSPGTWTLVGAHVHLQGVFIESAEPRAIETVDDQYLSSCTLTTIGGGAPLLTGWQFFNRDPTRPLGAGPSHLGFANCSTAGEWFPCPQSAPTCSDLLSPSGSSIGYSCA